MLVHNKCNVNPLDDITYTDKVKRHMLRGDNHSFPLEVDNYWAYGKASTIIGGDGVKYTKLEIRGFYKGQEGVFEYIYNVSKICNHRFFRRLF